jgi:probable O-glycosylation ligase (exosortase A-associated)
VRDLVLGIVLPLSLLWGLTAPMRGLIALNWICFMRPWTFSWGMWRSMPFFQLSLIVAFVSVFIRGKLVFRFPPILVLHLAFHGWILLANQFGYKPKQSWDFYMGYMVTLPVVSVFLFAAIRDLKTWKWVFFTAAGSLCLVAAKVGASSAAKGGAHITSQIDGFVGDNNVLGLTVCLAVACMFGLRKVIGKWVRFVFWPFITAAFLCIIFTKSRGAFLSMSIILLISTAASRNPVRNTVFLALFAWLGYLAVPATYFDRLDTFENIEEDNSAMDRIYFWGLSWNQAVEHPLLGIGLDNHMDYNEEVTPAAVDGRKNHVAHSVYFQILAETGFVGLAMYLSIIFWTLGMLHKTYRSTRKLHERHPDLDWVSPVAFWMRNGFAGYIFGSAFLNMLPIDFPWYFIWYSHIFPYVIAKELRKRDRKAAQAADPAEEGPDGDAGPGGTDDAEAEDRTDGSPDPGSSEADPAGPGHALPGPAPAPA